MHRSYQSTLPCHNKLLQKRWDAKYYNEHQRKISEARPMVDTRPPQTYMHLHLKMKKLQLEEERLSTVERDNRILLEKMSHIMRTKGRVNNRNNYEYKSLNREKRMRELLRVTQENQEILRRITQRKPEYDHYKWDEDWKHNQEFMDQIATYPKDWWKYDENGERKKEKSTMSDSGRGKSSKDGKKKGHGQGKKHGSEKGEKSPREDKDSKDGSPREDSPRNDSPRDHEKKKSTKKR